MRLQPDEKVIVISYMTEEKHIHTRMWQSFLRIVHNFDCFIQINIWINIDE